MTDAAIPRGIAKDGVRHRSEFCPKFQEGGAQQCLCRAKVAIPYAPRRLASLTHDWMGQFTFQPLFVDVFDKSVNLWITRLRGTFLSLDAKSHVLYTRGSVDFYATYPGMYMPRSLHIGCDRIEQTPNYLANEALALTKMNWNVTQFDGGVPITIRAARQVGNILKYVNKGEPFQAHYSYYM